MPQKHRYRWLLTILRYALCAGALAYLYLNVKWNDFVQLDDTHAARMIERRATELVIERGGKTEVVPLGAVKRLPDGEPVIDYGIASVVRRVDVPLALLALLLYLPAPLMQALRLVWLLGVQSVSLRLWDSVKLTFAGNFFNFALPGSTGGDLVKAGYLVAFTQHKTEAVTTLVIDRVVGLVGLVVLATVTFLLAGRGQSWSTGVFPVLASGLVVIWGGLCAAALVVLVRPLRVALRLRELAERLPGAAHWLRIGRTIVGLGRERGIMLRAVLLTLTLQMFAVVSAWVMSLALHMEGGFVLYFLCVPVGWLLAAVPIAPPQGFGVVEWAYIQFLTPRGLNDPAGAFALALAVRLIQFVWALPGMLVPLLGAHRPRSAPPRAAQGAMHESG